MVPLGRKEITEQLMACKSVVAVRAPPRMLRTAGDRLYYLSGREGSLSYIDLAELPAIHPVALAITIPTSTSPMSREEEMLRERQRFDLTGITKYRIIRNTASCSRHGDDLCLFVESGPRLFLCDGNGHNVRDVCEAIRLANPQLPELRTETWMDVKSHPERPQLLSFVLCNNVYVANIDLTTGGGPAAKVTSSGSALRTCGVADYILQEEFSLFSGQWWAPGVGADSVSEQQAGKTSATVEGTNLAFLATDVTQQRRVSLLDKNHEIETIPFPRVGDPNAVSSVVVSTFTAGGSPPALAILPFCALQTRFPWAEYVVRVLWRDASTLYLVVLSRHQEQSVHVEVKLADLLPLPSETALFDQDVWEPASLKALASKLVVRHETTVPWAWVETTNDVSLGQSFDTLGAHAVDGNEDEVSRAAHYTIYQRRTGDASFVRRRDVTAGVVFGSVVPQADGSVTFLARPHNKRVVSLCTVPPPSASATTMTTLTDPSTFVHAFIALPAKYKGFAVVASSLEDRPYIGFVSASGPSSSSPSPDRISMSPIPNALPLPPVFASAKNKNGFDIHYSVKVPPGTAPPSGWPLMMYVYGGPHVQLVNENYASRCDAIASVLVSAGVACAIVDGQVNHALGLKAHAVCKLGMGQFETEDYKTAAADLVSRFNVDPLRVGIYGWSYGGYATLLAMSQGSDTFKIGLAGAPVGDWRLYDTGYTERYMGLLPKQTSAYDAGSIATYASGFPDELDRVFIAHGTTDENVHLTNTTAIIEALVHHNKPYQLLLYPGERHGLRQNPSSRVHYDTTLIQTVLKHL